MDEQPSPEGISFFQRLAMACKLLFNSAFAWDVQAGLDALAVSQSKPKELPPERLHASGLFLLAALQREGRLIDFLQQEVGSFPDEEVGAAARVVHGGCKKVIDQYFEFEAARTEPEGTVISVAEGFDAQRIRLTGNVAGKPPYRGALKHHGWVAKQIHLPALSETIDPRVVAPAEVELS